MADISKGASDAFIAKWQGSAASELSTAQSFAADLCRLLGVDTPHADPEQQYMFERPITFHHGDGTTSAGRIDLYKRGAFVLEAKKLKAATHTKGFDEALLLARSQAERYARSLPASEGRPPFVIVVDVGNRIELYSEFSRSGATYTPFPDPRSHRIALTDLRSPAILERLRRVWTDPLSLDPSRESARVTREIAVRLATLARSLETAGHAAEPVAQFLMRCLFTMFAEDVKLLPSDSFRDLLAKHAERPDVAMRMLAHLWRDMDAGGFSVTIAADVLRFNGKLFKQPDVLPLDRAQLALLLEAAKADWKHVEPAIFGTLLERALDPNERHKLGAHYTPRAYVERLVLPTVIEPLRQEWSIAYATAILKADEVGALEAEIRSLPARAKERKTLSERLSEAQREALAALKSFHHRLCTVRVLDPACGSGNFLYVTLEHLKRLEGEVLNALDEFGYRQTGIAFGGERADTMGGETVDPHNLLGIELNPRAAAIAEVVLWIGYLQWHYRTRGDVNPPVPVIRDLRNIESRDAVLTCDRVETVVDERGVPVTRWDGRTMKKSPITGEDVPDETARTTIDRYINPRKAEWPSANFVVGNPPFIGNKRMRLVLGNGYVEALRSAWSDVPDSADFVMYWWHRAGDMTRSGAVERFGLITTNSIRQAFNRRVLEFHLSTKKNPLSLAFAIADHPWVDTADGAAVRIAMTVAKSGSVNAVLQEVAEERETSDGEIAISLREKRGHISSGLQVGASISSAATLRANAGLSHRGVIPHGEGMVLTESQAMSLGLGRAPQLEQRLRRYMNGRDMMQASRSVRVIDMYPLSESQVQTDFPAVYQWLRDRVKPERDHNARASVRERWWLFAEPRRLMREALFGMVRFIATVYVSKHRVFTFLPSEVLADDGLVVIALCDEDVLGVLSSTVHCVWAAAAGSTLEDRPRYNNSTCFQTFPFPTLSHQSMVQVGGLAARLDAHRKRQQVAYPDLTLTAMYNVLEKLRSGESLTDKERTTHEHGLVSILRQMHDEIDALVLDAYGWSDILPMLRVAYGTDALAEGQTRDDAKRAFDEEILERLVALNAERAAEEARGLVRWLRPEFQNPSAKMSPTQTDMVGDEAAPDNEVDAESGAAAKAVPWPKDALEQVRAVADVVSASLVPLSVDDVAARFTARGAWRKRLPQLLETLVSLGRARERGGKYSGA